MSARTWSFVDADGRIQPQTYSGDERDLEHVTPAGCRPIEGAHDWRVMRVVDGAVVDWRPDKPEVSDVTDWQWSDERMRWVRVPTPLAIEQAEVALLVSEIARIEAGQARALRESALDMPGAKARLQQIDDEIALRRAAMDEVRLRRAGKGSA